MYAGKRYDAVSTGTIASTFRCARCGFSSAVEVAAIGEGTGRSAYFLDDEGAQRRAHAEADDDVKKNVDVTLAACPCPKCGETASAGALGGAMIAAAIAVGVAVATGWALSVNRIGSTTSWVCGIGGGLLCAWGYWRKNSWKWATARDRVRFL